MPSNFQNTYLIDAYPLYCNSYQRIFERLNKKTVIHKCHSLDDISLQTFKNSKYDLVLFDVTLFGDAGLALLLQLRIHFPDLRIIISSAFESERLTKLCFALGAAGVISKKLSLSTIETILKTLQNDLDLFPQSDRDYLVYGDQFLNRQATEKILTKKELMTLQFLLKGLINRDIAAQMGVCMSTTKSHVSSIIKKLEVINRTQIIKEFQMLCAKDEIGRHLKKRKVAAISEARKLIATGIVQAEDIQLVI